MHMNTDIVNNSLIECSDIHKSYMIGKLPVYALRGISYKFHSGEFTAIMGPSGSGKSTLLHLLGGLDSPTQGNILFNQRNIATFSSNQLAEFRLNHIGIIFQSFNLIPSISALDNVLLPLVFANSMNKKNQRSRAIEVLDLVDLKDRMNHFPGELSGGEQQRVAIARAIANKPTIILADEPTGELDSNNSKKILELLKELNKKGQTIIMVTHDVNLAKYADKTIQILDGKLIGN
ncbi:MAG: ABC transporter ATP-binding protein [Candidatus Thorarchaeota archaeon]